MKSSPTITHVCPMGHWTSAQDVALTQRGPSNVESSQILPGQQLMSLQVVMASSDGSSIATSTSVNTLVYCILIGQLPGIVCHLLSLYVSLYTSLTGVLA